MKREIYEGYLVAETPIHHGGDEKTGAESLLRQMSYIVDGKRIEIPLISGNAIRGNLRRLLMADMLAQVRYKLSSAKIYHMLFSGGILETVSSKDTGVIDLDLKRKIRKTIIPIALLGSSLGNQIFEGKLKVSPAIPICKELKDYLPDTCQIQPTLSIYELLDFDFATRKDDLREEKDENEQATQMMYSFQVFIPGTPFHHSFSLNDVDDIEQSAFYRMLNLWKMNPYVGGKSSIGLGKVKICYDYDDDAEILYHNFLMEKQEEIREMLNDLEEKWG
ncbi:hypothetical protein B6U67_00725 [Methanosarcinales archaeon ex4484_138]|nr:MAG: hypothetical protein B6U67_00725 [Methanosarcinales archaeon ex4484_138]